MRTSTSAVPSTKATVQPAPRERAGERGIVGHVAGGRPIAARRQQPRALDGGHLPVGQDAAAGRVRVRRPVAIDERGEHRRVQQPLAGRTAVEARARRDEVRRAERTGERSRQARPRARVGVERHDDVARGRLEPLLQRPRLAHPPGRQLGPGHHAGPVRLRHVGRPVARAVVDHQNLEDIGIVRQPGQARREPPLLVPRRDDDAHATPGAAGGERRPAAPAASEPRDDDGGRCSLDDGRQHPARVAHGMR